MAQPLPEYYGTTNSYSESAAPLKYYWSWAKRGICSEADPQVFFTGSVESTLTAKLICKLCPVVKECLTHALVHDEEGFWGGLSQKERRERFSKAYREELIYKATVQNQFLRQELPEHPAEQWPEEDPL